MNAIYTVAFVIYPYIVITTFVLGHSYRYATDLYGWNTRSTELLEKRTLLYGITAFHWGIILTLFGHAGGMLIPQGFYDAVGINSRVHTRFALLAGIVIGIPAFLGVAALLIRRLGVKRVKATTTPIQYITLSLLLIAIGTGLYNVLFGGYEILYSVAPWIRGIVILRPDPSLMAPVPLCYKIHVLSALAILGFSPFTRLVHIWSVPLQYLLRRLLLFRSYRAVR